jgi:formylmethanofuran dehydrogenase subunit E
MGPMTSSFIDRTSRPPVVCTRCGHGWCEEHAVKIAIYNIDGKPVCEDCLEPSEDRETLEGYEW